VSVPSVFHENSTVPADIEDLLQVLLDKAVFPTRDVGIAPGRAVVAVFTFRYFPAGTILHFHCRMLLLQKDNSVMGNKSNMYANIWDSYLILLTY